MNKINAAVLSPAIIEENGKEMTAEVKSFDRGASTDRHKNGSLYFSVSSSQFPPSCGSMGTFF